MDNKELIYFGDGELTLFLGRNGYSLCQGFEFEFHSPNMDARSRYTKGKHEFIRVIPVTSKGYRGRAFIEIPLQEIQKFINTLEKIYSFEGGEEGLCDSGKQESQ